MVHQFRSVAAMQTRLVGSYSRLEISSIAEARRYMSVHRSDLFDLDAIVLPPICDLGDGLHARRALPSLHRRMIGPFVFLDHLGPRVFAAGHGFDMQPHPH